MPDSSNTLIRTSRFLLYATAVLPLVLWAGFTFPYVTIRTVAFRVIVEVVTVLALLLWIRGRVRFAHVKQQYFFWIFAALVAIESIAAFFGESLLASFFGDMERMWGIFTVLHLFLFYVLARIFFGENQWRTFFHVSLVASILASLYGVIQRNPEFFQIYLFGAGEGSRIMSTLGNPVYVAIYLLFNIAFALYLLMQSSRVIARSPAPRDDPSTPLGTGSAIPSSSRWTRYFYIAVIVIDFYAFTLTDIRGAYVGLLLGATLAGLAYVFMGTRRRVKQALVAAFVLGVVVLSLGVRFRSTEAVQRIPVLRRVASISLNDETVQTRFIGWSAAWKGFLEDPLTGVGMENYNILFNKHFPARYYLLAPTETYFDRSHNQFFNILAESGIVALLLYLAFPVTIGYYLIRGYRNRRFALNEFLLFGAMAIAYFVHLFFVFDDFQSLLFFAAFIALIESRYYGWTLQAEAGVGVIRPRNAARVAVTILFIPLVLYSIVVLNFNVVRAAWYAGAAFLTEDIAESVAHYRRALNVGLIQSENVTLNAVEYLVGLSKKKDEIWSNAALSADVLATFSEAERALFREIEKKPNDAAFYLKLGQLNNTWFLIENNEERLASAIMHLERAIELSPGRIQMYLVLGESYVLADESEKAVETLNQAASLEPRFGATYYYLGRAFLTNGDLEKAYDAIVNKAFIERRYNLENTTIASVLAEELARAGEYGKMVIAYEHLVKFEPRNARMFSALAAAYVLADRLEDAIAAAQKAAELDPGFAQEAAYFVQMIEEGRIDELKKSAF